MNELRLASVASILVLVGCASAAPSGETDPGGQGGGDGATTCTLVEPSTVTPPGPARDVAEDGRGPFVTRWAGSWGQSGVFELATDPGGGFLALAWAGGSLDLGGGVEVEGGARGRAFVARFDAAGRALWATPSESTALELVSDAHGGAWVTSDENHVTTLTHFDDRGVEVFHESLDLSDARMVAGADGGVLLAGAYGSGLVLGDGTRLPKSSQWDLDTAFAVVRIAADGRIAGATPLAPLVWTTTGSEAVPHLMTFLDVAAAPGGGAVVLYRAEEDAIDGSCSRSTTFLTGLDAEGGLEFIAEVPAAIAADTVTVDAVHRIITSGQGQVALTLASFDVAGKISWSNTFPSDFGVVRPIVDRDGDIFLAGAFANVLYLGGGEVFENAGAVEIVVAQFASDGAFLSARRFDGAPAPGSSTPVDYAGDLFAAALDADGALVVAGDYFGALDLGAGSLPVVAEPDNGAVVYHGYLARMAR